MARHRCFDGDRLDILQKRILRIAHKLNPDLKEKGVALP
jgi:hypothetical protein